MYLHSVVSYSRVLGCELKQLEIDGEDIGDHLSLILT